MERLNFIVEFTGKENGKNKYGIAYYYKGIKYVITGEKYSFDCYDNGVKFVAENYDELSEIAQKNIDELNEQIERAKAEAEAHILDSNRENSNTMPRGKKVVNVKNNSFKAGVLSALAAVGILGGAIFAGSRLERARAINTKTSITDVTKTDEIDVNIKNGKVQTDSGEYAKEEEKLTPQKFEELCNSAAKSLASKGLNLNTSDIIKYVAIFNIDKMSTDCPKVLEELVGEQKEEEFLCDAAKVIGAISMYNYNIYAKDGNTDGFVNAQEFVFGSQKEKVKMIDEYVLKVSKANKAGDAELTDKTARELIDSINDPTSELSYLDNGVGFGIQTDIKSILSTVSGNLVIVTDPIIGDQYSHGDKLSEETSSLLHQFSTAERYVSNILTKIRGCKTISQTDVQVKSAPYTKKLVK